uniref:PAR14-like first RRM domain-containing protein n=1 Tax=Pygocentrus nattereri TaxID=42514 RepID=A0A3B4D6N2_PYGNA
MDEYLHPLSVEAVEGRWPSASAKTLTAKLQIYFQSRRKSQGGDCVVRFSEQSRARGDWYGSQKRKRDIHPSSLDPAEESLKDCLEEPPQSNIVALEKLPDSFSKDFLVLLVEKISGVPEKDHLFFLFLFAVAEKFLVESRSHKKFQQYGVRGRALEKSGSVKVESLHGEVSADLLEVYFEKCTGLVENVTMIPEEQAAIVTFHSEEGK